MKPELIDENLDTNSDIMSQPWVNKDCANGPPETGDGRFL